MLLDLARAGVEADSGSACAEGAGLPSRILRATGMAVEETMSSLLFRVTASHSPASAAPVARALAAAAGRLRELAP